MQISCKTDVGLVRGHNEDSCCIGENYAVVADGMGGHNKGELASQIVVDTLSEKFSVAEQMTSDVLRDAVKIANRNVYAKAASSPECIGMGTTVVAAIWDDKKIYLGYIGDSRCYEVTKSGIKLLTKDHTLVQKLQDEGKLTETEALFYPDKHVITRAVGTEPDEVPDILEIKRRKNQWLVLCSDGLSNFVSEDEIKKCIEEFEDADKVSDELVKMANNGGGTDNITAVVIQL